LVCERFSIELLKSISICCCSKENGWRDNNGLGVSEHDVILFVDWKYCIFGFW
jgi:hypothetical protein